MKRPLYSLLPLVLIVVLAVFGNYIVARTLDAQLPQLLRQALGQPVRLAPLQVNLLNLTARSAELAIGPQQDAAVQASDVRVQLALRPLLRGEIHFLLATAGDLGVKPSAWPAGDGEAPSDYRFLEPWLPDRLALPRARFIDARGAALDLQDLQWQREGDGPATARWRLPLPRGAGVALNLQLASLADLLALEALALTLQAQPPDDPDTTISAQLQLRPGEDSGYQLTAEASAAGSQLQVSAGNSLSWRAPDQSSVHIDKLVIEDLLALWRAFAAPGEDDAQALQLDAPLAELTLPAHDSHVRIDTLRLGKEVGIDTAFDLHTGADGIHIEHLRSTGPAARIAGTAALRPGDHGWSVRAEAQLAAKSNQDSIASPFLDSQWLLQQGQVSLAGSGATWAALLDSLAGQARLQGYHRGQGETPFEISAQLDQETDVFSLDDVSLRLGDGQLSGSASLSGNDRRLLTVRLQGQDVDLGFLFGDSEEKAPAGMALPDYLRFLPGIDLHASVDVSGLRAPGLAIARVQGELQRDSGGGQLDIHAAGIGGGNLQLALTSQRKDKHSDLALKTTLDSIDLPAMFGRAGLLYSRTSGSFGFSSSGADTREMFARMRGSADLTVRVRADNDWQRASREGEEVALSGKAQLVLAGERITGVQISDLDIASLQQDLTGSLSLVAGRTPWLEADLASKKLDITALTELLPQSEEEADQRDVLRSLRDLGEARIALRAQTLVVAAVPLADFTATLQSGADQLQIPQLSFGARGTSVRSSASLAWQGDTAQLQASAKLGNVNIDQFLLGDGGDFVPVSGTLALRAEGDSVADLLAHLEGNIELAATTTSQAVDRRRRLSVHASRLADGMQARVSSAQFGASELSGTLRLVQATRPKLDIELQGGTLSLLAWEARNQAPPDSDPQAGGSLLADTARASADLAGKVLRAPLRLLGEREKRQAGERLFSPEPLPLESLRRFDLELRGHLDQLQSRELTAGDLDLDATLRDGRLDLSLSSRAMNGGKGALNARLDSAAVPPTLHLQLDFDGVRGLTGGDTYPRSGFTSLTTQGASLAALAANSNGLFYLELGEGPIDFANPTLLTADIATSVFSALIPGFESSPPTLDCGIVPGVFQDGVGVTPYGYALRTDQANILGRIEVDLTDESLKMTLDSRNRQGVGISVGSVFANTILVRGSLAEPRIVPNTTSLLWRGGAAFLTAGLSVVGESVIKRALASENPCQSIKHLVTQDLCPKSEEAAASTLVCPPGGGKKPPPSN